MNRKHVAEKGQSPHDCAFVRSCQYQHHGEQGKSVLTSSKEVLAKGRRQIMFEEPIPLPPMSPRLFVLADPV